MEHGANGRSTSSATTCESSPTRADRPRSRQHETRGAPSRAQLRTPRNQREAATTGEGSLSRLIELRSGTAFRFGPTHLETTSLSQSVDLPWPGIPPGMLCAQPLLILSVD